jgi:hypothetical protein
MEEERERKRNYKFYYLLYRYQRHIMNKLSEMTLKSLKLQFILIQGETQNISTKKVNLPYQYALVETIAGMGEEGIKENDGRVNLIMIYCKNFCECHIVPQYKNNLKIHSQLRTNTKV